MLRKKFFSKIFLFVPVMFLLVLTAMPVSSGYAAETPPTAPAEQTQFRELERQFVQAGVDETGAAATVQAMVNAGFQEQAVTRLREMVAASQSRGAQPVEVEAVRAKIHEGIAKDVTPEKIVAAAGKVAGRFRTAEAMVAAFAGDVNKQQYQEAVGLYAHSFAAGLEVADARLLNSRLKQSAASGNRDLVMETLLTARDMVRQKVTSATATSVLDAALQNRFSVREMVQLRASVATGPGVPEECAQRVSAAITQGSRGSDLQGVANQAARSGTGAGLRSDPGPGGGTQGNDDTGDGPGGGDGKGGGGGNGGNGRR